MIIKIERENAPDPVETWWISDVESLHCMGPYGQTDLENLDSQFQLFNESVEYEGDPYGSDSGNFVPSYTGFGQFCGWASEGIGYRVHKKDGTVIRLFVQASHMWLMSDDGKTIDRPRHRAQPSLVDKMRSRRELHGGGPGHRPDGHETLAKPDPAERAEDDVMRVDGERTPA